MRNFIKKLVHASPDAPDPSKKFKMLDKVIGRGGFAKVQLAECLETGETVAVKCFKRGSLMCRDYVRREILNQRELQHPHIIGIKKVFLHEDYLCIAMEYAKGGNLRDHVHSYKCLPEDWARWYFQQIIVALDFAHRKGVAVRDIKLENILLDETKYHVKLCDFGLSKHIDEASANTNLGTPQYLAPEIWRNLMLRTTYDAKKVDIWGCGVSLYFLLFGMYPFDLSSCSEGGGPNGSQETFKGLVNRAFKSLKIPRNSGHGDRSMPLSQGCRNLLESLLKEDPRQRIDMEEIINDPWFRVGLPVEAFALNTELLQKSQRCIDQIMELQSETEIDTIIYRGRKTRAEEKRRGVRHFLKGRRRVRVASSRQRSKKRK